MIKISNKKIKILFFLLIMCITISGCSRGNNTTEQSSNNGATVVKFAHDYTTNSPYHKAAEEYKRLLEEKTNNEIRVDIYPAQQLGSAREMIEGMQMGTIEMVWTPTAKFAGFDERLTLLDLPYLFPNEDIMWEALEGEIGEELFDGLEDIGLKGLSFNAEGYKQLTANKPIESIDDLKGMKIRTMEAPVIMDMFKLWGANPVPIDFAEVYNSLQQKVVDGQENPIISNHDMKFYEVQKHITDTEHGYLTYFLSASNTWFNNLSKEHQTAVIESAKEMREYHKQLISSANEEYMNNMVESGVEHHIMSNENRDVLKKAAEPLYEKYRDLIGGDLIDKTIKFGEDRASK